MFVKSVFVKLKIQFIIFVKGCWNSDEREISPDHILIVYNELELTKKVFYSKYGSWMCRQHIHKHRHTHKHIHRRTNTYKPYTNWNKYFDK